MLRPKLLRMSGQTYNALFLCTGNSVRSILAECLLRELGKGRFDTFSAGSFPKREVHPLALRLVKEQGFASDQAAGEVCPVWPGHPVTAHWGIPDPAAVADDGAGRQMLAFRDAFRVLEWRIKLFLALPIVSLDRMALQRQVDAIGRLRSDIVKGRAS